MTYRVQRDHAKVIAAAEQSTGSRLVNGENNGQVVRSRAVHGNPMLIGVRWAAAVKRVELLFSTLGKSSDMRRTLLDSETPELALAAGEEWANYMTREAPAPRVGIDPNPYRGMTTKDASRRFMRAIEDICDKSTAAHGPWWVR